MLSVSVIIPTIRRPQIVQRAILSVLAQRFQDFEIIVVVDGPDATTAPALLKALDARIRVLQLSENGGLAEARNQGIYAAHGKWIALLDDDDEWLPEKLGVQVKKAIELGGDHVFVPCRFIEKTMTLERVMPTELPDSAERFSEYMYCDGGYLQPSIYFMSRALAMEVPFTKGLRHVEDSDWLLRMAKHPLVRIGAVEAPLSIYYNLKEGTRESETTPWAHPLSWAIRNHTLFTPRAFPFFVARLCLNARRAGEPISVLFHLLNTARRYGTLTPKVFSYFIAYWFLPADTLRTARSAARSWTDRLLHRHSVAIATGPHQ